MGEGWYSDTGTHPCLLFSLIDFNNCLPLSYNIFQVHVVRLIQLILIHQLTSLQRSVISASEPYTILSMSTH